MLCTVSVHARVFMTLMGASGGGAAAAVLMPRAWTYETSLLVNQSVDEELPPTQFHEYFAPDYCIAVVPSKEVERDNQNKKEVSADVSLKQPLACKGDAQDHPCRMQ